MILGCRNIVDMVRNGNISNAVDSRVSYVNGSKVMSFGVGPSGYDVRLGHRFAVLACCSVSVNVHPSKLWYNGKQTDTITVRGHEKCGHIVDPIGKVVRGPADEHGYLHEFTVDKEKCVVLFPRVLLLCETEETFSVPDDCVGFCFGKSTYARCGLLVNATPLEPGWKGRLVLELSNVGNTGIVLHVGEGIAQIVFARVDGAGPYIGSWQNQTGIKAAKQLSLYESNENEDFERGRWNWWGIESS